MALQRALDAGVHVGEVAGLADEVGGAEPRGLDRGVERAAPGHDQALGGLRVLPELAQDGQAVGAGQREVDERDVVARILSQHAGEIHRDGG